MAGKGFASMDPERQRALASLGGKSAQASGRAHRFTSTEARHAGRKGGATVAKRPGHMAAIGRIGGLAVANDAAHMTRIAKRGGAAAKRAR